MNYYKSPEEMFLSRASHFKKDGDLHWAMAKNGFGDYHYGKAKLCYEQASLNHAKAKQAHESRKAF